MNKLLKFEINGNMLKTIALIAMVIDHIGFYFKPFLDENVMLACRYVGRIAMPIFTYLVVQGFFHTKNFKRYVVRMGVWAGITQIAICGIMIVNLALVKDYTAASYSYKSINILFTYVISLLIMKVLYEDIIIKKWDYNKNMFFKIVCITFILIVCSLLPLDYGVLVPVLSILFYFIEKMKIQFFINTEWIRTKVNKIIKNQEYLLKIVYVGMIFVALLLVIAYLKLNICAIFAIVPIALYNGERGNKSKILKNVFYYAFVLQHVLLYITAMLINVNISLK